MKIKFRFSSDGYFLGEYYCIDKSDHLTKSMIGKFVATSTHNNFIKTKLRIDKEIQENDIAIERMRFELKARELLLSN